jgi:hypothetical protein
VKSTETLHMGSWLFKEISPLDSQHSCTADGLTSSLARSVRQKPGRVDHCSGSIPAPLSEPITDFSHI